MASGSSYVVEAAGRPRTFMGHLSLVYILFSVFEYYQVDLTDKTSGNAALSFFSRNPSTLWVPWEGRL